ncbi:hypothetical protein BJ912DRAFT_1060201 [Pholiota molesta]|nr:hypothetical protein BJ912DRAFT_1060201 [Pholiota molesta]
MRDVKKAKVEGGALSSKAMNKKQKEKDKKKKKRKKKRRTSVVLAISQPREREASKPLSSTVAPSTPIPKRKSPEPTNGHAKRESENETVLSSSDKGKGKARSQSPPRRVATPVAESEQPVASGSGSSYSNIASDQTSEINRLKEQLATQTALLERHQTYLSNHQQSITCQICLDLMYKPYALAPCGHTTCYGCLVRWFTSPANPQIAGGPNPALPDAHNEGIEAILNSPNARNGAYLRRRKNCPVCRAVVSERPIEMWGIKGMVAALVKSGLAELPVPLEPVVEENADNNNDPWRNIFRRTGPPNGRRFAPIGFPGHLAPPAPAAAAPADERADMGWYDAEDGGIYRCNDCYHEILYGRCTQCRRVYPGHMGYDDDDDDDDDEDDGFDADELHIQGGIQRFIDALMDDEHGDEDDEDIDEDMFLPGMPPWGFGGDEDDDEEDEEFMDGPQDPNDHLQLHGQIERDIFPPSEEDDEGEEADEEDFFAFANRYHLRRQNMPPLRRGARIEEVGSEDEDEEESDYEGSFIDDGDAHEVHHPGEVVEVEDDEDSEDDEVDALDRPPCEPHAIVQPDIIDLTDSEEENAGEDENADDRPPGQRRPPVRARPQILAISSDEDEDANEHEDDAQHTRSQGRQPNGPLRGRLRNRTIVVDDDDDDSHGEEAEGEEEEDRLSSS